MSPLPKEMLKEHLQNLFSSLNMFKFGGKLPYYEIKIWELPSCSGRISYKEKIIKIKPKSSILSMNNTLLHELTHAYLYRIGCKNTAHSVRFWRLFVEKGGVITETNKLTHKRAKQIALELGGQI